MANEKLCEEIAERLDQACVQSLLDEGYPETELDKYDLSARRMVDEYMHIEVREDEDGRIIAEVRAELSYDSMMDLLDDLDPIVQEYSPDAYFDMVDAGIAEAVIDLDF